MSHYDKDYFDYQRPIGEFGGWANKTKFDKYIEPTDTILDFGCGGGYLLDNIDAATKIGIEINADAREHAKSLGITVYDNTDKVTNTVDVIISNHALEHVKEPYSELVKLKKILRKNGLIIFVVPSESVDVPYKSNDINQHLYTWSPMCLGNLFTVAGFQILDCAAYHHRWPPNYLKLAQQGREIFDAACRKYAQENRHLSQTRIIGIKK